jgi:hypothetical protein
VRVREHPVNERGPEVGQRIGVRIGVRVDDRATAARVLNVLDAYRDFSSDNLVSRSEQVAFTQWGGKRRIGACLFHGKRMDDLAAVVRQFGSFLGGDDRKEPRGDNLARVRSEDAVNFLPYLQLRCTEACCQKRGRQIGVSATHLFQ